MKKCYICGLETHTNKHHVYEGADKSTSDIYGFIVDLCFSCHRRVHDEQEQTLNKQLKKNVQRDFEDKLIESGLTQEEARTVWRQTTIRNYL